MIILDKKKAMFSIMAKRHPKDGIESELKAPVATVEVKTEEGETDPRFVAAEDIMLAIKDGKADQLMEALAAFIDLSSHRE